MRLQTRKSLRFWFCSYIYYFFFFNQQDTIQASNSWSVPASPASPLSLGESGGQSQAYRGVQAPFRNPEARTVPLGVWVPRIWTRPAARESVVSPTLPARLSDPQEAGFLNVCQWKAPLPRKSLLLQAERPPPPGLDVSSQLRLRGVRQPPWPGRDRPPRACLEPVLQQGAGWRGLAGAQRTSLLRTPKRVG